MQIKTLILEQLNKKDSIRVFDIVEKTNFSRAYVSRVFKELREDGKIVLIGKANRARYVKAEKTRILKEKRKTTKIKKRYLNAGLSEDFVFNEVKKNSGILFDIKKDLFAIINYAFTEMLNNAIDHSRSEEVEINIEKNGDIKFSIVDQGVGIFNNIMKKKNLANQMEAIQDLLKGKQTTAPEKHSGEGIFFTSKIADNFIIESSDKRLIFNNNIEDIFVENMKRVKGTRVVFIINTQSNKKLEDVFKEYTGENFEFSKTRVDVRLYKMGSIYISRSQAKRVMNALGSFKHVVLDFKHIKTIGQSFADEIFRVWQNNHPDTHIEAVNVTENINFMIKRAVK
jgi:anti-sigma regulatory factor (Ser/Thr protein kinase)/DNA-binding transcriptional regulator YhcF (GntR family)